MFGTAVLYASTVSQQRVSKPQQRDRGSMQSFSGDLRACLRHLPCLFAALPWAQQMGLDRWILLTAGP